MKKTKSRQQEFSQQETQLIEQLRQHSAMMQRVQSIVEIALNVKGPLKTADEVEALLIEEMRQLGSTTIHHWAARAKERVSREFKQQDQMVLSRKKTLTWWCVFGKVEVRERLWCSPTQSYLRPVVLFPKIAHFWQNFPNRSPK
jgi:hypothetical protein